MKVVQLDLKAQFKSIEKEVRDAIDRVLESQHFILGPEVEALENELSLFLQCKGTVGVSSGSDALLVSLMALDIKEGDEVITTPYTFFATAGAISRLGAKPVFVDIDEKTYNIDPSHFSKVISKNTKAVLPVHLFGQMADMNPIVNFCKNNNLFLIEDAAQAIGSSYQGKMVGSFGDVACYSFFPSKNLGTLGDGGLVSSNNPALLEKIRILRSHGSKPKYYHKYIGGNFRLDALMAAVLREKLKHLNTWTKQRKNHALKYLSLLQKDGLSDFIQTPYVREGDNHIFNQLIVRVKDRENLIRHLKSKDIETAIYYPVPMHLQECFKHLHYKEGDFPKAELAAKETMALPLYPELSNAHMDHVIHAIKDFYFSRK